MKITLYKVAPSLLKPHPRNSSIYGDEDISSLAELIRQSGWVKPLVCTPDNVIISGHRRWRAVQLLGWSEAIPVEYREFSNESTELEALLLENASRLKTTEQKVREAQAWKDVEAFQAGQRKLATLKKGNFRPDVENFPHREQGKTRDAIASRVGLGSGRTYSKAAKVIAMIDEEASIGHLETAQALRKVLNEQSVDAAHQLLKQPHHNRSMILAKIATGEAKDTKQAQKLIAQQGFNNLDNKLENVAPTTDASIKNFSIGDWIEVNDQAKSFKTYIGTRGQVEQVLIVEQQISVNLEGGASKVRFYANELTLIVKAAPPSPFRLGDIVCVDIDRREAACALEKKWNGFWGLVTKIGETGSIEVTVGKESLQLFARDLKAVDAPSFELQDVVNRVLRLRNLELDEIEEEMLDVIQRRDWFTPNQLVHLENIEKLYPQDNNSHPDTSNTGEWVPPRQSLALSSAMK